MWPSLVIFTAGSFFYYAFVAHDMSHFLINAQMQYIMCIGYHMESRKNIVDCYISFFFH